MATCKECIYCRPNGVCDYHLCTPDKICDAFEKSTGNKTCGCGWWSCGTRGCGDCPDCYGEVCECDVQYIT